MADIKFIVGVDAEGNVIECSYRPQFFFKCADPSICKYLFPGDAYLTKIMFKKEVLDKYYQNPQSYGISSSADAVKYHDIDRDKNWSLIIDNNLRNYVMVYLGDLNSLPEHELYHWRGYNVSVPRMISQTAFARDFNSNFCDPVAPDLLFREKYGRFNYFFHAKYGQFLFLPLRDDDAYCLNTLNIPSDNNPKMFDLAIAMLVKAMIDSLNEKFLGNDGKKINVNDDQNLERKLRKETEFSLSEIQTVKEFCVEVFGKNLPGIKKLKEFLAARGMSEDKLNKIIVTLKKLQQIRSTGIAHRKGGEFDKVKEEHFENSLQNTFLQILYDCILVIDHLSEHFLSEDEITDF